jgi:methionyl-tRNA formyltransferase
LSIPDPDNITVPQLTDFLAPTAADLLIRGLRDRVFVPPLEALGPATQNHGTASFERPAPKIRPEDRHIDWRTWSADQILRRNRVLGRLWNTIDASLPTGEQRILWSSGFTKSDLDMGDYAAGVGAISPSGSAIFIRTVDGQTLTAGRVIMEGSWEKDAGVVMRKARLLDECRGVGIGIEEQGYAMLRSPFT